MKGSKVILDTNIWVSFFIMAKLPELKRLVIDNELRLFTCDDLIDEIRDVLKRDKLKKYLP